ncbi:MAG: glucose-6-phosphate dehydrogenase [Anaerolineales bacterium]|nr:glucose-6-phosphate dehydrogenase [Anaerolineales bacterium]
MGSQESKPTTIIIFGASGDLSKRKLLPALFNSFRKGRLPEQVKIIGYSRREWSDDDFRSVTRDGVERFANYEYSEAEWSSFVTKLIHVQGGFNNENDYRNLSTILARLEQGNSNRLYYLAVPPRFFTDIITGLAQLGMTKEDEGWRRIVVEKPFGSDLPSAEKLNRAIHAVLDETQIYRIDHYLGKETVQNVLVFRFANTIFEPVWNRNYIDHVQITVAEDIGVGHRADYYDGVGVLKDMFQNHLLQLLTLVAMEPPATFQADALRNEKTKVLSAIRPIPTNQIAQSLVRAQYHGYREEPGVASNSETPTYAALRLYIDNWRWQGVPFYLRSGKSLAAKSTEVMIHFKSPPHVMFPLPPDYEITANILALCIQPDEGIRLRFDAKVPDTPAEMRPVDMEFHYAESFGEFAIPDAYERLLLDAIHGDASLFTRSDEIEMAWGLIDKIIAGSVTTHAPPLAFYEPGSWGPAEAEALIEKNGHSWLQGCSRLHKAGEKADDQRK